jgi:hypothetical protein
MEAAAGCARSIAPLPAGDRTVERKPLPRGRTSVRLRPGRVRGALLDAAKVVVGGKELLVLGRVRRDVGRGAALLLRVLEVAAKPGLALGLVLALQLLGMSWRISWSGSMPLAWMERPAGV